MKCGRWRGRLKLYLIRHPEADTESEPSQGESGLTEKARTRLFRVAQGLARMGMAPGLILSSPLPRVRPARCHGAWAYPGSKAGRVSPGKPLEELVQSLRSFAGLGGLGLVGHQLQLQRLASLPLTGSPSGCEVNLKKLSAMYLRGNVSDDPVHFVLQWMIPAKALRRL